VEVEVEVEVEVVVVAGRLAMGVVVEGEVVVVTTHHHHHPAGSPLSRSPAAVQGPRSARRVHLRTTRPAAAKKMGRMMVFMTVVTRRRAPPTALPAATALRMRTSRLLPEAGAGAGAEAEGEAGEGAEDGAGAGEVPWALQPRHHPQPSVPRGLLVRH
jgi:hypothetical protein